MIEHPFLRRWNYPHDAGTRPSPMYGIRFMLRLDEAAQTKLQQLISHFGVSKATIIRRLIMQATPEDFPRNWHMRAAERSMHPISRRETKHNREVTQ
jgi:hypothetical protein